MCFVFLLRLLFTLFSPSFIAGLTRYITHSTPSSSPSTRSTTAWHPDVFGTDARLCLTLAGTVGLATAAFFLLSLFLCVVDISVSLVLVFRKELHWQ
jgi:hypothetical protein